MAPENRANGILSCLIRFCVEGAKGAGQTDEEEWGCWLWLTVVKGLNLCNLTGCLQSLSPQLHRLLWVRGEHCAGAEKHFLSSPFHSCQSAEGVHSDCAEPNLTWLLFPPLQCAYLHLISNVKLTSNGPDSFSQRAQYGLGAIKCPHLF